MFSFSVFLPPKLGKLWFHLVRHFFMLTIGGISLKKPESNLVPRVSLLCLPWSLEEFGSFFQRPSEAEKKDPGNEVEQRGLYQIKNKITFSPAFIHRPGN